jgi:squalene cyclase
VFAILPLGPVPGTAAAVKSAVGWLVSHQNANGSWSASAVDAPRTRR